MALPCPGVGVTTQSAELALMTQGSGSPFNAMKAILFQNNFQPSATTVLSQATEATFDGYAAQSLGTFPTPYIGADGLIHLTWPSLQFTMTGSLTPNQIYGWGLTNTAKTVWVAGTTFPAPINMSQNGDAIVVVPDLAYGQ